MASDLPEKVVEQMARAGLPSGGQHPFRPKLTTNRRGEEIIEKQAVATGPKRGKVGYVDDQGRIWVKDRGHAGLPDHWDVQICAVKDKLKSPRALGRGIESCA